MEIFQMYPNQKGIQGLTFPAHLEKWWVVASGKRSQFANLKMAHRNSWFSHEIGDFP